MDTLLGGCCLLFVVFIVWAMAESSKQKAARKKEQKELPAKLREYLIPRRDAIRSIIEKKFLVQPCSRCHEDEMGLLDISPNARSIHYECAHCGKKMRAAVSSPDSSEIAPLHNEFLSMSFKHKEFIDEYNSPLGTFGDSAFALPQYDKIALIKEVRSISELSLKEAKDLVDGTSEVPEELLPTLAQKVSKRIIPDTVVFYAPRAPLPYEQTTRSPIPEAVRHEVWRRDGGQCVNCGSKENLQFDHIIPVAKGGATTVQNLQLLCQSCNQAKGTRI